MYTADPISHDDMPTPHMLYVLNSIVTEDSLIMTIEDIYVLKG